MIQSVAIEDIMFIKLHGMQGIAVQTRNSILWLLYIIEANIYNPNSNIKVTCIVDTNQGWLLLKVGVQPSINTVAGALPNP